MNETRTDIQSELEALERTCDDLRAKLLDMPPDKLEWPSDAPPWANWMAMEMNRHWWAYALKPIIATEGVWGTSVGDKHSARMLLNGITAFTGDWRDSLIERPKDKPEQKAREWWYDDERNVMYHGPHNSKLVHVREVLPNPKGLTFEEWRKNHVPLLEPSSMTWNLLEAAWDASAANSADFYIHSLSVDLHKVSQLTRERDGLLSRCGQHRNERDQMRDEAFRLRDRGDKIMKERDEARKELERARWDFDSLIKSTIKSVTDERDALKEQLTKGEAQAGEIAKEFDRQIAEAKESHRIAVSCALKAGCGIGRAATQMEEINKEEWGKVFQEQLDDQIKENVVLEQERDKLRSELKIARAEKAAIQAASKWDGPTEKLDREALGKVVLESWHKFQSRIGGWYPIFTPESQDIAEAVAVHATAQMRKELEEAKYENRRMTVLLDEKVSQIDKMAGDFATRLSRDELAAITKGEK